MAPEVCEELMRAWFPTTSTVDQRPLTELDIQDITQVLSRSRDATWSEVPRIYSVLRMIGQLQAIEYFLGEGITDVWFPFSQKSLPSGLKAQSARLDFLDTQHLVFNTKALDLERGLIGHGHFQDATEIPLRKIGELGKGSFGYIDRVVSTISHREYARKLMPRGRTFRRDRQILRDFERELSMLKSLSRRHRHIVELVGSYTDPRYVGILMLPVADCNLYEFLGQNLDQADISLLRTFFGCLTSALCFLHDNRVRHKDIKPHNVLIKNGHVFLTDFGLSLDWTELDCSITTGPTWSTPRYCAPEVAEHAIRSSSADIWSLGCVFLEMWTVLKSRNLRALQDHMQHTGTSLLPYYANSAAINLWIDDLLAHPGPPINNVPIIWIKAMLERDRNARWSAHTLMDYIHEHSSDATEAFAFAGLCCLDEDETAESVYSSPGNTTNEFNNQSETETSHSKTTLNKGGVDSDSESPITVVPHLQLSQPTHSSPVEVQSDQASATDSLRKLQLNGLDNSHCVLDDQTDAGKGSRARVDGNTNQSNAVMKDQPRRIHFLECHLEDEHTPLLRTSDKKITPTNASLKHGLAQKTEIRKCNGLLTRRGLDLSSHLAKCGTRIKLRNDFNFAKCRCEAEFCMLCGTPWKACSCPFRTVRRQASEEG